MKRIKVELKTLNPIIISKFGGDSNMLNTRTYIPGSTILGVFAKNLIKKNKINKDAHKNSDFKSFFLEENLIFQNLYIKDENNVYFPNPYSIRQGKNGNEIYDLLLQDGIFEKPTKSISSYSYIKDGAIYLKEVKRAISFHHTRDIISGTSKKEVIFNYEYIKQNQIFFGLIIGDDSIIDKCYKKIDKKIIARIGKSKNSQYGRVIITLSEPEEYIRDIEVYNPEEAGQIVMTFLSDAIIYNRYGYSITNIKDIETALNIKIRKGFIKQGRNEQFIGVWKLKKPSKNIIGAGSCFLLERLPENYRDLEKKGIGERRNEGFGRIIFGYQKINKLKKINFNGEEKPQRSEKAPQILKTLVLNIIKEKIALRMKRKAMEAAFEFKNLPSKSLLGKLQLLSKDIDKFKENFKHISNKEIAKTQLFSSHNKREHLLDFVNKKIADIELSMENVEEKLLNEIELKKDVIFNDTAYIRKLKSKYFMTFFYFLRKRGRKG